MSEENGNTSIGINDCIYNKCFIKFQYDLPIEPSEFEAGKANFETAISKVGFGKFNVLIIITGILTAMATIADNTVLSYVIPVVECDLNLSTRQKGLLNSSIFLGEYSFKLNLWN